jgi:hypothetical protein
MSDVDSTTKLVHKLQNDAYSNSARKEDDVEKTARELKRIIREQGVDRKKVHYILEEPENTHKYQDLPVELVDRIFQATEELDPFQIVKLDTLVG